MHTFLYHKLQCAVLMALVLTLSACGVFSSEPPAQVQKKPSAPSPYAMEDYTQDLSYVHFLLTEDQEFAASVEPRLAAIASFATKKDNKPVFQPAIIISYSMRSRKGVHYLAVPFDVAHNAPDFPYLQEALLMLDDKTHVVQDIHPAILTSPPARHLRFAKQNPKAVKATVDQEFTALLAGRTRLEPLTEARVQFYLLQFCMANHFKETAYLAAENASQSLAIAENNPENSTAIKLLSDELYATESQLHKEMPLGVF